MDWSGPEKAKEESHMPETRPSLHSSDTQERLGFFSTIQLHTLSIHIYIL